MDFKDNCVILLLIILNITTISYGLIGVRTSKGRVRGVRLQSKANSTKEILAFKGIPYAKPPIGQLRFKAPEPADLWLGNKMLSAIDKPLCPQVISDLTRAEYNENCLYVNIYTPSDATPESQLPVMVYIHGGGFMGGGANYNSSAPDYLVDQNIIVVIPSYRLGALGFLNLGTDDAPGNAGMKDQVLALKWVQEEIEEFGGNPNNVTLFGESAGSASVHFHVLSNMSKGLFQKAIGESGTALSNWAFLETGYIERAKKLATALNCSVDGNVNITCLQECNVEDIVKNQQISLSEEETAAGIIFPFVPTLEVSTTKTPFLNDTPSNLMKNPANKVPMIMGTNEKEGLLFSSSDPEYYASLPSKMKYFIPNTTRNLINDYTIQLKVAQINESYFNNTTPSLQNAEGYINLLTDQMFALGTANSARELLKSSNIYLYRFDFDGNFRIPFPIRDILNVKGAGHVDELGYLFVLTSVDTSKYDEDTAEKKMLRKMVKLWTNFAKYGTPTLETEDSVLGSAKWVPISENSIKYLVINGSLEMSTDNYLEKSIKFWNNISSTVNIDPPPSPTPITPPVPTSPVPTVSTTQAPTVSTTEQLLTTTQAPIVSTTEPPTVSTTQAPIVSTTEPPTVSTTQAPIVSTTEPPTVSTTQAPIVSTTEPPTPPTTVPTTTSTTPATFPPPTDTPTIPPSPSPSKSSHIFINTLVLLFITINFLI